MDLSWACGEGLGVQDTVPRSEIWIFGEVYENWSVIFCGWPNSDGSLSTQLSSSHSWILVIFKEFSRVAPSAPNLNLEEGDGGRCCNLNLALGQSLNDSSYRILRVFEMRPQTPFPVLALVSEHTDFHGRKLKSSV